MKSSLREVQNAGCRQLYILPAACVFTVIVLAGSKPKLPIYSLSATR